MIAPGSRVIGATLNFVNQCMTFCIINDVVVIKCRCLPAVGCFLKDGVKESRKGHQENDQTKDKGFEPTQDVQDTSRENGKINVHISQISQEFDNQNKNRERRPIHKGCKISDAKQYQGCPGQDHNNVNTIQPGGVIGKVNIQGAHECQRDGLQDFAHNKIQGSSVQSTHAGPTSQFIIFMQWGSVHESNLFRFTRFGSQSLGLGHRKDVGNQDHKLEIQIQNQNHRCESFGNLVVQHFLYTCCDDSFVSQKARQSL
mmetsp:Transcript_17616/g.43340  ORF Transcript_17616/g.43340 Transcript_17616/m.43340 type:complete len:257 (+) Transcript_17616:967-1737(+)